ncbi:MAG TPA: glycine/sarcosine/betaine reductase selenoprotein B family protein [Geothermobacteraceae bacterium]|nr:glycine/sarcosine/betaine reductase selenoprotein B family protein [Geothermobacteraceae bacterium]
MNHNRLKNRLLAWLANRCAPLRRRFIAGYRPERYEGAIPWTPVAWPLAECRVALVTTAGVHHPGQPPFDMHDPDGDPSYRVLDGATILGDYRITHDYYDHRDADRDLNVVFPLQRLRELVAEGIVGGLARRHYSLMGHIVGRHLPTLLQESAPQIARALCDQRVDIVLLTPG